MISRRLRPYIEDRLEQVPAVILLGPRQVGKTTQWRGREAYRDLMHTRATTPSSPDATRRWLCEVRELGDQTFLAASELRLSQNRKLVSLVEELCRTHRVTLAVLRSSDQARSLSRVRASIANRGLQDEVASLVSGAVSES
jgi:hypothetical protein